MAVTPASQAAARQVDDLYRRHGPDVYRYALAVLGNHADAEDVTQTTFLNAYRALEQGVRPRKPVNWLLTITSNGIKQRYRQEKSRPRQVELARDVAGTTADDETPSVGELLTALAKIPPQQRQAIVLREFEGRSYTEIADILGTTISALETLLFRARRSLAEELEQHLTCTEAQLAVSRAADGRLGRKERRRLREHLAECPDCAGFARLQKRHSRALRGLALVPIPLSLSIFKSLEGGSVATAATLPAVGVGAGAGAASVGAGAGTVAVGSGVGTAGATGGGILAGGVALKAAAVVAAVGVAGGAAVGARDVVATRHHEHSPVHAVKTKTPTRGGGALSDRGQGAEFVGGRVTGTQAGGTRGTGEGTAAGSTERTHSAGAPGKLKKAAGLTSAAEIARAKAKGHTTGKGNTKSTATTAERGNGNSKTQGLARGHSKNAGSQGKAKQAAKAQASTGSVAPSDGGNGNADKAPPGQAKGTGAPKDAGQTQTAPAGTQGESGETTSPQGQGKSLKSPGHERKNASP